MADVRLLFPHEYLNAADLRGKEVPLTIASVYVDSLRTDKGSEKKPVLTFVETDRKKARGETCPWKLVLNRTNARTISKALGTHETDEWVGKRITLFATTCLAFGETKDCIRVREKAPPPARNRRQPEPPPEPAPEPALPEDDLADDPFGAAEAAQ